MYFPCDDCGKLTPFSTKEYRHSLMVRSLFPNKEAVKEATLLHDISFSSTNAYGML